MSLSNFAGFNPTNNGRVSTGVNSQQTPMASALSSMAGMFPSGTTTGTINFDPNAGGTVNTSGNMVQNYGGPTYQSPNPTTGAQPNTNGYAGLAGLSGWNAAGSAANGVTQMSPQQQASFGRGGLIGSALNNGQMSANTVNSTPAGLNGSVNNNRYGAAQNQFQPEPGSGRYRNPGASLGGGGGFSPGNATQWNTNYGPIDTGVDAFQGYTDSAYAQAMRQLQPQMDQQARALDNQLQARGLQPGTAAWNAEKDRLSRSMNDAQTAAAYGAQQAGLNAQNQYFNQEAQNQQLGMAQANQNYGQQFGYDQLANQRAIAQQQAAASSANASANAQASMYGADLRHALGMNQLNENARQYDIGNITQTYGMDQNFLLGALGQLNNFNSNNINAFNAQNNANNMYFNQLGGMLNNAPGVNFVPNTGYVNSQINANQYLGNANQNTFDNGMSFLSAGLGMLPGVSDSRLKKNIEHVGNVDGVNVYEFDYIDDKYGKGRRRGVMADEVIKTHPHAVRWIDGFMAVLYHLLPVDLEVVA